MKEILLILLLLLSLTFRGCKAGTQSYPIEIVDRNNIFPSGKKSDPLLLIVTVAEDGKLKINKIETGTISNLDNLSEKLKVIFEDREKLRIKQREVLIDLQGKIKEEELGKLLYTLDKSKAHPILFIKNRR